MPTRLPAEPLLDLFENDTLAALHFSVTRSAVEKWRHRGLTLWQADRLAVEAGTVPERIWPEYLGTPDWTLN